MVPFELPDLRGRLERLPANGDYDRYLDLVSGRIVKVKI
jgi:hypothetical protein